MSNAVLYVATFEHTSKYDQKHISEENAECKTGFQSAVRPSVLYVLLSIKGTGKKAAFFSCDEN